jgi:hypothetical protein
MPGVYRIKKCPNCKKDHRRRGPFCCQGCHNSFREVSDKQRQQGHKLAEMSIEKIGDPSTIARGHLLKKGINTPSENFAIEIPEFPDLPEGYDIADKW